MPWRPWRGHYAHYDIVAYDGETVNGPLSTFVVSYGYTDLVIEDGELVAYDSFCHADYIANQNFDTIFSDAATQAIQPPWCRPLTCTRRMVSGKSIVLQRQRSTASKVTPNEPLSMDRNDPLISDDDNDGKPGVTVGREGCSASLRGEIYIARREIFAKRNDALLRW